ncbi:molybdopterin molybdotransferase MoeA [Paenibacillus larvae]|nr:gephyrin-like molybdotransferase Glp [Paenibacillus larvae]MDT2235612.1 molybdopterin molybdotransferase MoeA [Paenibacillus larvae]
MGRFEREALTVKEALERVMAHVPAGNLEKVKLEESIGRRLASDVHASHPVPHFRRSGMDGYAVRSSDTAGASAERPVLLEVVETVPCGSIAQRQLQPGQAARIMTGAAVPDEADAVIMFEMTASVQRNGRTYAAVRKEMRPGANVTPVAQEMPQGELILEAGRLIGAGEAALLAMFGHASVPVYKRPRVAIFATGTELLRVEEQLQAGRIRNSNGYMLAALVQEAGALPDIKVTIPDKVETAKSAILAAMDEYDLVLTTGGVSVGDYDVLYDMVANWDGKLLFNKLRMRPGSPTTAGIYKDRLLLALSGNPGACYVGFILLPSRFYWACRGKQPVQREQRAYLATDYGKDNKFTRYVRSKLEFREGQVWIRPACNDASSMTTSIKDADCLMVIPPHSGKIAAGELVSFVPIKHL